MKNKKSLVLLIISFFTIFLMSTPVMASIVPGAGQRSDDYQSGNYELNDILVVGIQVTRFILGIVGSLSLLFFIYGGVMFLISAGSSDKVQQAKTIIINATIGLIIVFTSYIIIEFAMDALNVDWRGTSSVITRRFD